MDFDFSTCGCFLLGQFLKFDCKRRLTHNRYIRYLVRHGIGGPFHLSEKVDYECGFQGRLLGCLLPKGRGYENQQGQAYNVILHLYSPVFLRDIRPTIFILWIIDKELIALECHPPGKSLTLAPKRNFLLLSGNILLAWEAELGYN
jgi:hypothetical protein